MKQTTRKTRQGELILGYLRSVTCHPTAEEIHQAVVRHMPQISLGTVYRNLGKLAETGEIQLIENTGGQRRYDGNPVSHVHASCTTCGRVADVDIHRETLDRLRNIADTSECGFKVTDYRLQLVGQCPQCNSNNPESCLD